MNAWESSLPAELADGFNTEHRALPVHNTNTERAITRKYCSILRQAPSGYVMAFARELLFKKDLRWQAYEVIAAHPGAFHNPVLEIERDFADGFGAPANLWLFRMSGTVAMR